MLIAYFSYAEWAAKNGYGKLKDEESRVEGHDDFAVDDLGYDAEQVPMRDTSRERDRGRPAGSSSES